MKDYFRKLFATQRDFQDFIRSLTKCYSWAAQSPKSPSIAKTTAKPPTKDWSLWEIPDYLQRLCSKEKPMRVSFKEFYLGQNNAEFLEEARRHGDFLIEQDLMLNLLAQDNRIRIDFSTLSKSDKIAQDLLE